ncbi:hypothetical protein [Marivivens aquimaris]|uniref:hypothetical protein n=1 Tax=Marivivens aquimaris TaxID=2774876 RepID=UPI0018821636|nr:hypothetical protein [Marivivens aquimaris]
MVKELVIHLGDCKTGTTSIQRVLSKGLFTTESQKICYTAKPNHAALVATLKHKPEDREAQFLDLANKFAASDADIGIISDEHFEFIDPVVLHEALTEYMPELLEKTRLICYVRPHAARFLSGFAERTKAGRIFKSMETMHQRLLKSELLFYTPRLEKWRSVFGEKFHVRPFIRSHLRNSDVVEDFFEFTLRSQDFSISADKNANTSLSLENLALLRFFHTMLKQGDESYFDERRVFGTYLSRQLTNGDDKSGTKLQLHKKMTRKLISSYREDAARIDAEFFDRPIFLPALESTLENSIAKPQSLDPQDHFSSAEIQRYTAIAKLCEKMLLNNSEEFRRAIRPGELVRFKNRN